AAGHPRVHGARGRGGGVAAGRSVRAAAVRHQPGAAQDVRQGDRRQVLPRRRRGGAGARIRGGARHTGEVQAQGGAAQPAGAHELVRRPGAGAGARRGPPRADALAEVPVSGLTWKNPAFFYVAGALVVVLAIIYALETTRRRRLLEDPAAAQLARMAASVS